MFWFLILFCIVFMFYLLFKVNVCEFSDVFFLVDFVLGSLDSCYLNDLGEYVFIFLFEDKFINFSFWFYFSVIVK